jgi:4-hydroxythreonine-4-phosphate dehydrogenase
MSSRSILRIALTPGEPAGIGPDLTLSVPPELPGVDTRDVDIVVLADRDLLAARAACLGIRPLPERTPPHGSALGVGVEHIEGCRNPAPGLPDPANAPYVLRTLDRAIEGCLAGEFDAIVTGPVQKSAINAGGIPFTGHTEYLAAKSSGDVPVMLLVAGDLRIALATTHLRLRDVPDAITQAGLMHSLRVLRRALEKDFGITNPHIGVCGLNPHAGEGGYLGREELETIIPALEALRAEGYLFDGPLPGDTAFTPPQRARHDAYLSMFHDQGLPVLKALGFGHAVNVTLGLPFIRTSVDHGTALDLAGTGRADGGSLMAALSLAIRMARHRRARTE